MFALVSVFIQLLLCLSSVDAGRIGAFRFRAFNNFGTHVFEPYDPLALRYDNSYVGKLTYFNGTMQSMQSPRAAKLQKILDRLPYSDKAIADGQWVVHMVVQQQSAATEDIETSDLNSADHTSGGASLQTHHKKINCTDDAAHEVLEFEISEHTAAHMSMPDLLDEECVSTTWKDRQSWTQNPYSLTEKTTAADCADGQLPEAYLYRDLKATFTADQSTRTERRPEAECLENGDEEVLSFTAEASPEVFTEQYVLEEECNDNADASDILYAFNADERWEKSSRDNAVSVETETVVDTAAQLPFFKNRTTTSSASVSSFSGTASQSLGQSISRKSTLAQERNSKEPAFTVTAWVKGFGQVMKIASGIGDLCGRMSAFSIDSGGQLRNDWGCSDTHASALRTTTTEWTHVAFRYDGYGKRSVVVGSQEEVDVQHDTSKDYFADTGGLVSATTHNAVIVRYNELGDVTGNFEGYSLRDCYEKAVGFDHLYFKINNGVCQSSASKSGSGSIYRRSIQYMITEADFTGQVLHGPFSGQLDEVLVYDRYLSIETIVQIGAQLTMPDRFNGTSRIDHPLTGMSVAVKRSWTRYADFSEDDVKRSDCYDSSDERYAKAIEHETYSYSGEGRGYGERISYTSHSGALENISSLSVTDSLTLCNQEHFDTKLVYHSYQETSHDECMAQQVDEGACLGAGGMLPSTRNECAGTFYPARSYAWQPDNYELLYDVSEDDCTVGGDAWGQSQPLLFGAQGRNLNVFSDHEMTFYWKNKVGGETQVVNRTDLHSMQEWCRGTISCAGLQLDGDVIYPVEAVLAPQNDTAHGYRACDERFRRPVESAMQCFLHAASATGPEGLIYISGDEFRSFTWGYEGSETGTACYEDAAVFKWTNTQVGTRLCSDEPSDYEFLPFEQSRWQRDNDSITSTKEDDCTLHKLDWRGHDYVYETRGTGSRPHFVLRGQKSWQREPVDCLYATDATFAINKSTARECRDEAIFWSATGYSFQRVGSEFVYLTARHFTHPEEARAECQRLHANRDGPENAWDLCTNAQWNCAADDSCITSDTPDDTIFAVAACCFNTGTSCAITTNTDTCTPKHGYESFSFRACADEQIENTTNTTYNVYDPVWARSEWRAETRSRTYDAAYYDIVEEDRCGHGMHLSYDECLTEKAKPTYAALTWLGEVYSKERIAGCAVEGTDMYYNRYRYDSAKRPAAGDTAICKRTFEHFTETFDYSNTKCRYLNHELEVSKASLLECQNYADQTGYTAFSFSGQRCLLAKDRGPCEEDALWSSRFFVSPEAVEQFQPNTNKEFSILPVLECAENVTSAPRVLQVPWGPETYGVAWQLPVNATAYASEAEAKAACLSDCPAIYKDASGSYWALDRLEGDEMEPTDPSYALHLYRLRNVDNFDNRRLVTVFPSASKEDCHAECLLETSCRMVQYAYGQCMFFDGIYETLATEKLSYVLYEEIKGAVSYGPSGDCWLYKNNPGQRFSDASDGDCRSILTTGSGYKTFPVDKRLAGENKVVYILTEPDLSQAALASNIVHEERSEAWCNDRDGQGAWTAYPAVVSEKEHDDCSGTWTRNAAIERQNVLQRECELSDSKASSWTRNSDAVTETKGKGGYALNYQNGYALRLGVGCGTLDLEETDKVYGQACLNATLCSEADRGHGYAVIDGACFSYLHEAGGNASDCRWERSIANASSFLPLVRSNFADSVEACNARATCEGICERLEAGARAFVLATSSVAATPLCHAGWTGDDCTRLLPSYNTDDSITDKRHSAIDYCERQGQRLCPKQTPFPMGNLLIQIAPQSACVHYEAQTECAIEDYSAIEAVASCCGRTEKSGKMLVEAVVYDRVRDIGPCSYPKGLSGSMVVDSTAKLKDAYSVQQIAKALCAGGNVTTGDCEAACLAESSCNYFSNTSATCTLHSACTQLTDHFDDTAATFRLRRKAGLFDKPQQRHELIGDCKYHATVRAAAVIDQVPFEEATDELVPWRCERGSVVLDRSISFLRHSLNESFKFDVMEEHSIDDNTSISLSYESVRYTDSVHDTLEGCLDSNEGLVNAYDSVSKRCRTFQDPASALRTEAAFLGQSFRSAGLFEEFRMATDEPFEVLQSRTAALPVVDWSLSSAADECEAFCLQNECDGYVLSGQDCKLVSMPNSTMLAYMRAVEAAGTVIVRLRTPSELVCRPNASAWQITQFEAASMPPLALTELLGTASTLQYCKQLFFGDKRTPRLDVFLYDPSTGECRISLLRDTLVASEGASTVAGFSAYRIAVAAMNPRRTEATKYETEDIARETCLPPDGVLAGRDCLSHECAPFWFREEDVIRHEITRDACNPTLPPELPLLSFAWDRNRQGTLTFNVEEDTCRESQKFLSWRTGTEGTEKVVVQSEAECLNKSTADLTAVFLGNEPLPDHRSACNGIVDEHSFERLFPHAIQMAHSESTRIVSTQASIDECAAHANAYYAHQNRSTESKVFEYNFVDTQCAIFSEIECPTLCLPDETAKQGFFAFRLHGETGLTAASCWLLSVLDSQSTGNAYCRQCPLGKHSARAGSNCLPCQQGRYADEEGLRACKSCPEGTFQFGSGETHCHNCPAGSYQDIGEGKRSCKLCAAGKYEQNNTCHDCPAGTAAPNNFESNNAGDLVYSGANYKGPLLYYDPRFDYSDVHGISYKEADGTYMKGYSPIFTALRKLQMDQHDSVADCISCTAGTYADQTGASECKACAEGQFNAAVGATGCTECNIGEVARPSDASFHDLMPFACFSAEELGEYKDTGIKTGEDIGLIREEAQSHLEDCFESCKAEQACLFVSYKASVCRLHRKCDERGEAGWAAYRMSRSTSSISDSTAYVLSVEATVYGPSHHECEEESLLVAPETYVHFPDHGITTAGTIATAFTFQDAIDQCNTISDCIGFTYAGAEDVSLRTFEENAPILLKNQGDKFEQNGLQAFFKEQPVETKKDCQQQCAQLTNCTFMEWNGTKACRKWSSCTPVKKASLEAPESSLYRVGLSASHRLFPFQGRWPCDAVVFGGKTKEECEAEAVARTAPMFFFDDGACHVYVSYTSNGIDDLYSGLAGRQSSICLSGSAPPPFETATGFLYALGKRTWDEAAVQCSFCPAGLHTEVAAATVCRQCQAGTYDKNPQSSNPCEACELGRFQDEPGQATCKACSAGRYQDETGGEQCKASGQGYRAIGQGLANAGTQDTALWAKTSGPLQTNTNAQAATIDFEGATGKEICGRNSFAAGYENMHCKKVPVGAISVTRERVWTKEQVACLYEKNTAVLYVNVSASLSFYEGDLFNRGNLKSVDDCIAFANEQSTAATARAVAVSFGGGFCHFFSDTADGVTPKCIVTDAHESASLSVSEAQFSSQSDEPSIDPQWYEKFTPHGDVRFVGPYECVGLHYEYIGDYFSATDCTTMCRMQEAFGKNKCRYVSYSSNDNKCYFVNWKASGTLSGIYESTVTNIEEICSYGSREVPLVSSDNEDNEVGSGGYKTGQVLNFAVDLDVDPLNTVGKRDADGIPSMGINGFYSTSVSSISLSATNVFTYESSSVVETAVFSSSKNMWKSLQIRAPIVYGDHTGGGYYEAWPITLWKMECGPNTGTYDIDKTMWQWHESGTIDTDTFLGSGDSFSPWYTLAPTMSVILTKPIYNAPLKCIFTTRDHRTGNTHAHDLMSNAYANYVESLRKFHLTTIDTTFEAPNSEWYIPECDAANKRSVDKDTLKADCRWARKKQYERIRYALLRDRTLPSNAFPDYKLNGGYHSDAGNILKTMGFYDFEQPIILRGYASPEDYLNTNSLNSEDCEAYADSIGKGFSEISDSTYPLKCFVVTDDPDRTYIPTYVRYNTIQSSGNNNELQACGSITYVDSTVITTIHRTCVQWDSYFRYKKTEHYHYNHGEIRPLFDVGENEDNFYTTDTSVGAQRAVRGGNAYEYCTGSTTQLYVMLAPKSCDDLGFPFVADEELSLSSSRRICNRLSATLQKSSTMCCIGSNCAAYTKCSASGFSVHSDLLTVQYTTESALKVADDNIVSSHSDDDEEYGLRYIKDRCNQLGDACLGISSQASGSTYTFYVHGHSSTFDHATGRTLTLKAANYALYGFFEADLNFTEARSTTTIHDCYQFCLNFAHCANFFFDTSEKTCRIQTHIDLGQPSSNSSVAMFKLHTNGAEDTSKAQYCSDCPIGKTASSSIRGAVGVCRDCEPGSISSTSDIFVAEEEVGQAGQEQCQECPSGMVFLATTHACVACPVGFACPRKGSIFEKSVVQCKESEYSTSSLLDFVSEDLSSTASLRCEVCSAGKYTNEKGSQSCVKCPKGYFATMRSKCEPCPLGTYTIFAGSEECFAVDSQSFIAWPASTLSEKKTCTIESGDYICDGAARRVCTAEEDAYCQACPHIVPGHETYFDPNYGPDGSCRVIACANGFYSTHGCIGQGCCIPCTSNCKAGQHSVGCGGPDDNGGSTQNTQCADCPVNQYTEFDAIGSPCVSTGAGPHFGSGGFCSKCDELPHRIGEGFTTAKPWTYLYAMNTQTHTDQRRCAAGNQNDYNLQPEENRNSFSALSDEDRIAKCCSAAAYQCIACRSSESVSYSYSYDIGVFQGSTIRSFGRTEQPAWSTNGLTGQTHCQSYWYVWNKAARDEIVAFDAQYAPVYGCTYSDANNYNPSATRSDGSCTYDDCFPSEAIVETPEGKKPIYALEIGDFALSHEGFSEVYLLGHADNESVAEYLRLTTDNGTSIRLSKEHFIESNGRYVYAKDVKKGDRLAYGERVIGIEKEKAKGLWNPFTIAGTIVVDGVLASCHSDWFLESLPEWMRPSRHLIPAIYQTVMGPARHIHKRNRAWVRRFTESFEGKAIGEHSLTDVLKKMWMTYGRENVSGKK